jgi:hypothetical protein
MNPHFHFRTCELPHLALSSFTLSRCCVSRILHIQIWLWHRMTPSWLIHGATLPGLSISYSLLIASLVFHPCLSSRSSSTRHLVFSLLPSTSPSLLLPLSISFLTHTSSVLQCLMVLNVNKIKDVEVAP